MKLYQVREFGIDNLTPSEADVPVPGHGQVLVKMRAASLNYRDLLTVKGAYNPRLRRPMIPLSDGVGTVEAVGPGVKRFQAGDRVTAAFMQDWIDGPPTAASRLSALGGEIDGVLREYALFAEHGLVHTSPSLTDQESAALPCAAVTAWHALFEETPMRPGQSVLLQGTGGVSLFALQFAKAAGLRTILTSSSDEKLARARELGANEVINYRTVPAWEAEVRRLTGGEGVDQVIEVGGSDTLPRSVKAVGVNGVISVIGVLSGVDNTLSPTLILMNNLRLQGIYVGSRIMLERVNRAIELHAIKPVIGKTFHWTEVQDALRYMESAQHFGKICLSFE